MPDAPAIIVKENPYVKARRERREAQAKLDAARDALKLSIGKTFTGPGGDCRVTGFDPDKDLAGVRKDAYVVTFDNPNQFIFIHCDEFNQNFKPKD